MSNLRQQWNEACLQTGIPALTLATSARLMAILMHYGNNEATRRITACYGGHIYYKLKFQCRDGRFKMTMLNFEHHNAPGNATTCVLGPITDQAPDDHYAREVWNDIRQKIDAYAADMKGQMERLPMNTDNDDW